MGLFDKLREPIFLKESSSAQRQLEQLQSIDRERLPENMRNQLDREIKLVSLGIQGEKTIEFELRNSHMPMYVLHDLYIEHTGLTAQIDYLVVTRRLTFVIECKNLYGNIEINDKGDFIRTIYFGSRYQKEGIYSPVTQNRRHLELIKQMHRDIKKGALVKAIFDKISHNFYRSVIVLANPKTILNDKDADKSIKGQVIRADALISYIKQTNAESGLSDSNDDELKNQADFFFRAHKERDVDYAEKYRCQHDDEASQNTHEALCTHEDKPAQDAAIICPRCGTAMVMRTAKKGNNVGKQFWGCSAFPKCRGIIEL